MFVRAMMLADDYDTTRLARRNYSTAQLYCYGFAAYRRTNVIFLEDFNQPHDYFCRKMGNYAIKKNLDSELTDSENLC